MGNPLFAPLGVSNYVTTDQLPADSQFADVNTDPKNFRLQARLPNATTNSMQIKLEVKRDGAVVFTHDYALDNFYNVGNKDVTDIRKNVEILPTGAPPP